MNITVAQALVAIAIIASILVAGALAYQDRGGWGWSLFIAVLLAGAIFG